MITKKRKAIAQGTRIRTDFDKNRNTNNPNIRVTIAVLVPDWNIPHITAKAVIKKNILSLLIFDVMLITKKAVLAAAALQP